MNSSELKGKTAIVTGGARGIGRAIVAALAVTGANVVIADAREADAQAAAAEIQRSIIQQLGSARLGGLRRTSRISRIWSA